MQTFGEMHDKCNAAGHPCSYWGERKEWYVAAGQSRDSGSLERSNFRSLLRKLGGESDTVAVERENHWAVGWVEHLLIDPADAQRVELAERIREKLDDYPVVDESDWSDLEWGEFWETAEYELKSYDGWADVLHEKMEELNTEVGHDTSEWEAIEAAREHLENPPDLTLLPNWEKTPIDLPGQMPLY